MTKVVELEPVPRDVQVLEPTVIPDVFVDRLLKLERVGSCWRLTFAVPQKCIYDGSPMLVVVARLVIPGEDLAGLAAGLVLAMNDTGERPRHPEHATVN